MSKDEDISYRKTNTPKPKTEFFSPLEEALKDMDECEQWLPTDIVSFPAEPGSEIEVEKHRLSDDSRKVKASAGDKALKDQKKPLDEFDMDKFSDDLLSPEEIQEILESSEEFYKHFGI